MKSVVIIIILFLFNNIVFSFSDSEIKKKAQKDSSIKKTETKILSAKCLLIKENKPVFTKPGNQPYYVFVRVNLKDGWGELVKMGEINKLENVNLKFTETKLKNGEFGCLYSHIKVLNEFLKTNEPYCFVCEDDLDPDILQNNTKNEFNKKIKDIISKINNYGIISLSCVGDYKIIKLLLENTILNNKNKFVSFQKYFFYGTGCYLINRETAKKIVDSYVVFEDNKMCLNFKGLKTSMVADNFIYIHANTKFYIPSLFFTKDYKSIINNNSNSMIETQNIMKGKNKLIQYSNTDMI